MKSLKYFFLLVAIIAIRSLYSQTTIAVLEFDANGIEGASSSALATIVRNELTKYDEYRVVDRNLMSEILKEQEFNLSGCVSSECVIEVGKLLGVEKIFTGSLSGLGSLYLIEIQIINVETGEVEKNETIEHIGKIETIISPLRNTIKQMISGVSNSIEDSFIYIESKPSGAGVYLDGIFIGSSPIKYSTDRKMHTIAVKATGYSDWIQTLLPSKETITQISAELLKLSQSVNKEISSELPSQSISKWEVLGITRDEYIQFLRLGINERDWLEKYQSAGLTIMNISDMISEGILENNWTNFQNMGITPDQYLYYHKIYPDTTFWQPLLSGLISVTDIELYKSYDIPSEYWTNFKLNGINRNDIELYLSSKLPIKDWIEYKKINISQHQIDSLNDRKIPYDFWLPVLGGNIENLANIMIAKYKTINYFIENKIISWDQYNDILNRNVKEYSNNYYFFNRKIAVGLSLTEIYNIEQDLGIPKTLQKSINIMYNTWKNDIFNATIRIFGHDNAWDIASNITLWEWYIVQYFNISNKQFIKALQNK